MKKQSLIKTISIPSIEDDSTLCFAQIEDHLSFAPKRIYYILRPKKNEPRGYHAHHQTDQLLFCIQGKVKMILDNGKKREEIILNQPNIGISLPRMLWHEMHDMDEDTILLVLASEKYDEADYIRDYQEFKKITANG